MSPTLDHGSVDTLEEGQIISPNHQHKQNPRPLHERITAMDSPATATISSTDNINGNKNHAGQPFQGNMPMNHQGPARGMGDTAENSELEQRITSAPRRLPPPEDDREGGYERRIGRGRSWRRESDTYEQDYIPRGRGRGYRGRGIPRDHDNGGGREYYGSFRGRGREYDRRPPPMETRYPPESFYESPRAYPSPAYDTRRDYPPHPPASETPPTRYYDDYRRGGYEPRELPPPLLPAASSHLPTSPRMESRRPPYDRIPPEREDPEYRRPYPPRPGDQRDDYARLPPPERLPPPARDSRFMDEGNILTINELTISGRIPPRRLDDPAIPLERRPRDPLEYREETERRTSLLERPYPRIPGGPPKNDSPSSKPADGSNLSAPPARTKEPVDPARERSRENLNTRPRGPPPPAIEKDVEPAYGYTRDRPAPPPPVERYREPEYGRDFPPSTNKPREPISREPPFDRPRDPRDPYYDYPPPSNAEYRGREPYPPQRGPIDYPRNPAYEERYPPPPRRVSVDLENPRPREGYRDLPPRSQDYGPKRKFPESDYVDPYDDPRVFTSNIAKVAIPRTSRLSKAALRLRWS
jgi:hypothetical protein